jgi:hypothetical protein
MAINKISQEKINQIKQKSVITLPNQPKISAEELKARFVKPITDTTNSTIAEINRIVDEVNDDIENANNLLLDHDADELAHADIRGLITALDADKADVEHTHSNYTTEDAVQTKINTHNSSETAHTDIRNAVAEAKAIAEGKVSAMSFETKAQLDAWLEIPENVETLIVGTNFYIEDLASPDYWWNGTTLVELSTDKIDLTEYAKKTDIPNITVNNGSAESGKYISQVAVDETDKHKLVITKADLPQGFSGNYEDLTNKPTIPTVPTISTNITTDALDDTKTASPKAVKTYVDNAISTALDNLLGGEY